ncbi:MAG: hypothetical protein JF616_10255 [Fibrobacteres bacterium]|jgi:hypothetical protein|nr:hypothetical protein [Fibrobacterota bacterium]
MLHRFFGLAVLAGLSASLLGCATMAKQHGKAIFLHGTEGELNAAKFYLDGNPVTWSYLQYSASEVSRTSTTVTYNVTSLPAIVVPTEKQYYTLSVQNGAGETKSVLLKRDLIGGYKFVLYIDLFMTMGIGDVVDTYSDNLFGLPELDMDKVASSQATQYEIGANHGK